MNVIFMGTPGFAVPALELLYKENYDISLVITQPDKPYGRGKKIKKSEVKEKAEELNLEVFQPEKVKVKESVEIIKSKKPDVIVVAAYGQILSKEILEIPKYGCINIHASTLPKLRGAAPINWALINGDEKAGITIMQMDEGLDTGDMLLKSEIDVDENMDAEKLHDNLKYIGGKLIIQALKMIEENKLTPQKQENEISTYAPILTKENTKINWNKSAKDIHNLIRGLSPYPTSYFSNEDMNIKVYKSEYINEQTEFEPGYVIKVSNDGIYVAAKEGVVVLKEIQMPGKKRMDIASFIRGNEFPSKIILQ